MKELLEKVIAHIFMLIGLDDHAHILHDFFREMLRFIVIGAEDRDQVFVEEPKIM